MTPVRRNLLAGAVWIGAAAIGLGALMVLVFDWSLSRTVRGGLIGCAVWGVLDFVTVVRHQLPGSTRLLEAPAGATIEDDGRRPLRLLLWLPVFAGLAWVADHWILGAFFVPGQLLGYALSGLVGALLVGRWQRRHGGTVLVRWNDDEAELYVSASG